MLCRRPSDTNVPSHVSINGTGPSTNSNIKLLTSIWVAESDRSGCRDIRVYFNDLPQTADYRRISILCATDSALHSSVHRASNLPEAKVQYSLSSVKLSWQCTVVTTLKTSQHLCGENFTHTLYLYEFLQNRFTLCVETEMYRCHCAVRLYGVATGAV